MENRSHQVSLRFRPAEWGELEAMAERIGSTPSALVRKAVEHAKSTIWRDGLQSAPIDFQQASVGQHWTDQEHSPSILLNTASDEQNTKHLLEIEERLQRLEHQKDVSWERLIAFRSQIDKDEAIRHQNQDEASDQALLDTL